MDEHCTVFKAFKIPVEVLIQYGNETKDRQKIIGRWTHRRNRYDLNFRFKQHHEASSNCRNDNTFRSKSNLLCLASCITPLEQVLPYGTLYNGCFHGAA